MLLSKLDYITTQKLYEDGRNLVNCLFNTHFQKKGINKKDKYIRFRYYSVVDRINVYLTVSELGIFVTKNGKNVFSLPFVEGCIKSIPSELEKCSVKYILDTLKQLGIVKDKPKLSKSLQRILQDDINKVLLPGNKVVLNLFRNHPVYYRLVLTLPDKGKSTITHHCETKVFDNGLIIERNLKDDIIVVSAISKDVTLNSDILIASAVSKDVTLNANEAYLSIYYEHFSQQHEITKLPLHIYIPLGIVSSIYIKNSVSTYDIEKLKQLHQSLINSHIFNYELSKLVKMFSIESWLGITLIDMSEIILPVSVPNVDFKQNNVKMVVK